jgi:radical SAM superfamily enzyme YgiQ (UPF0313 family)
LEVSSIKILLLYPEVSSFYIDSSQMLYGLAPPLGLLYIGAMLESNDHEVTLVDFSAEPYSSDRLKEVVLGVDVIGISVLTPSIECVKVIIQQCRRFNPNISIIIGGAHCTLFPENSLSELDADICIQGDGEETFIDVLSCLSEKKKLKDIPGVYYRDKRGSIFKGPVKNVVKNIDLFGIPARHLVEQYVYGKWYNPQICKGEFTSIVFSRGCPYRCRFCSRGAVGYHQFRRRSVDNILVELEELAGQGYRYISVNDDCFPTVKQEAMDLFTGIVERGFDFKFYLNASRVNLIDQELLEIMHQAGVVHIQFGLESGSQKILDFYQKETTVEQIRDVVIRCHNMGFFTAGSFILVAPIETKTDFLKTIYFAEKLPLDSVSYLPLRYMAGSSLWEWAVSKGKIRDSDYLVVADKKYGLGNFTKEELVAVCTNAHLRYYLRPKYFLSLLQTIVRQNNPEILISFVKILGSS